MDPKLRRRLAWTLNYIHSMTYCGTDAEWHFKKSYNPQIILDTIELLNNPDALVRIESDTTPCPYCQKPVNYDYIPECGILSSLDYQLVGDFIFHSACWEAQIHENPLT